MESKIYIFAYTCLVFILIYNMARSEELQWVRATDMSLEVIKVFFIVYYYYNLSP